MPKQPERSFGLSVGTVLALVALYSLVRGREAGAIVCAGLAAGLIVAALTRPALLKAPSAVWWRVSRLLGWVNSRVFLTAFFVAVVTPVGLALRITGWDPLRQGAAGRRSGWSPYPARQRERTHYDRMY